MDKAAEVLKKLENEAEKEFVPSIGPIKGKILEDIIKNYKPNKILEIGTLFSYSAILIARFLPDNGKVITLEINENSANIARKNIDEAGLSQIIEVIVGDALEIIPTLKDKFDLLFIDATKEDYLRYLKLAEKNLKKGSVVVADNVGIFEDQMLDYLEYVRTSGEYESETVNVPLEFVLINFRLSGITVNKRSAQVSASEFLKSLTPILWFQEVCS